MDVMVRPEDLPNLSHRDDRLPDQSIGQPVGRGVDRTSLNRAAH